MPPLRRAVNMFFDFAHLQKACSKTLYQVVHQRIRNRNALKPTGTASSRGSRPQGWRRKCSTRTGASEIEHFYPVPICFGVIRELMQHPLEGCGVFKRENRVYVSRGMLLPHQPGDPTKLPAAILRGAPFGLSSPTREKFTPPKMRDILFVLFDKVLVSHRDNRAANSTH